MNFGSRNLIVQRTEKEYSLVFACNFDIWSIFLCFCLDYSVKLCDLHNDLNEENNKWQDTHFLTNQTTPFLLSEIKCDIKNNDPHCFLYFKKF